MLPLRPVRFCKPDRSALVVGQVCKLDLHGNRRFDGGGDAVVDITNGDYVTHRLLLSTENSSGFSFAVYFIRRG